MRKMVVSLSSATNALEWEYSSLIKMQTHNKGQGGRQAALSLFQLLDICAEFNLVGRTVCITESDL